jgi:hypothetical protein
MNTSNPARNALAGIRLTLGIGGLVAPGLLARSFGIDPAESRGLTAMIRVFAARELMMGVGILATSGPDRDRWLRWGAMVDAGDVVSALLAGIRRDAPARAVVLTGAAGSTAVALGLSQLKCGATRTT